MSASLNYCRPTRLVRLPRASDMPDCPICADSLVAAEGSAFAEGELSYLWSCETCGYGFVTRHAIKKTFACN